MNRFPFIAILLIGLSAFRISPVLPFSSAFWCDCDRIHYWQLTELYHVNAPFGTRVLKPLLVRALPVSHEAGTIAVTIWSLVALGALLYALLRRLKFEPHYALIGVVLAYAIILPGPLQDVYLVDSLGMAFMILAIYAAVAHRFGLFVFSLVLGVLTKETVFVTLPVWYVYNPSLKRALLAALPAFTTFLLLRLLLPAGASYLTLLGAMPAYRALHPVSALEYLPFGILPVFMLLHSSGRNVLVRFSPLIIMVYAQLLVAGDTKRLLIWAFVPVLIAALYGIRMIVDRSKLPAWSVQTASGLYFVLLVL